EPAGRQAEMLGEAHRRVGAERKAGDAQPIDVARLDARFGDQCMQRAADPPMGTVNGEALIGNRNRDTGHYAIIGTPRHATRFFIARVSIVLASPASRTARSRRLPRWTLLVAVSGSSSTKAT